MASASLTSPGGPSRPMALPGHSAPLRYANAQDLPSYPSPGLKPGDAAASAAATLGWASTPASPTSTAAGPGSPREHRSGTSGSQNALLAAGWAQRQQKPPSSPASHQWVSTAANLAFRTSKTPPPSTERSQLPRHNSMSAALGAMAGSRPRAASSPQAPTKSKTDVDAGSTALTAATLAHQPTARANPASAGEAGAVPYTTMDRQMFTARPPVKPETDEKQHADVLHASALAMAKQMYETQQKIIDRSARAHARSQSFSGGDTASLASSADEEQSPLVYNNLQEAAYRLAQERLAKLQQEHEKQRDLQEYYYGSSAPPQRSKLGTIKGKLTRRRSSSDGDLLMEDKRRSEQIRNQMSLLNNRLSEVDEEKRARDREALLAAAQRNVKAQMQRIDEKVQSDTGRVPQVTMDDWGRKALVAARARFDAVEQGKAGKVDIGGGKLMDRAEVDKIAARKVQPLLDEINDRAEKEAARQEEERLEEERRKELAERDRMREMEVQEIHKKLKDQQKEDEKARKAEIKREEKAQKEEMKAAKAEQKHAAKEEKQKQREILPPITTRTTEAGEPTQPYSKPKHKRSSTVGHVRVLSISFPKRPPRQKAKDAADKPPNTDDNSPTSPTGKVRAWLLSRFPRPRAKSASTLPAEDQDPHATTSKKGFIGGVTLARLQQGKKHNLNTQAKDKQKETAPDPDPSTDTTDRTTTQEEDPDASMREVALAGRETERTRQSGLRAPIQGQQQQQQQQQRPISQVSQASVPASVSSLSSSSSSEPGSGISVSSSSGEGNNNNEEERFVEARSELETSGGSLAPGTAGGGNSRLYPYRSVFASNGGGGGGAGGGMMVSGRASPFRESRFSEIL